MIGGREDAMAVRDARRMAFDKPESAIHPEQAS